MLNIRIARATESDIPEILGCIRGLAEYQKVSHHVTATEDRLRDTLFGPHPAAEVILAFCGGECTGLALFFTTYSSMLAQSSLYLDDLYVKPHWRGQGIGAALLEHLAAIGVERGCCRLEWMVLDWNRSAIKFYENRGAVLMSDWTKCRMTAEAIKKLATEAN